MFGFNVLSCKSLQKNLLVKIFFYFGDYATTLPLNRDESLKKVLAKNVDSFKLSD